MGKTKVTGVFFSNASESSDSTLDYNSLLAHTKTIPGVTTACFIDPTTDSMDQIERNIIDHQLNRVVLTGEVPGMLKSFFTRKMVGLGHSPDSVVLADFNEFIQSEPIDSEYAKTVITCAVHGIPVNSVIEEDTVSFNKNTLVIGGGISGIQASLEIANGGHPVYLVEKTGTIGGHMAMFDKTFPTLDCAACILTPKMVDVGQHPQIELMTYSEVESISGKPGNFKVKVKQKARKVDLNTCIGCGNCSEKCPGTAKSEFDAGTAMRKSIYIPFPQAVPNKYLVDAESCLYCQSNGEKCGVCIKFCPVDNCINLDEQDRIVELTVGNIIVATGFKPFDAAKADQYGYGKFPDVVTSLEFERLVNAAGPTGGYITRRTKDKRGNDIFTSEGKVPDSIALIHCIGSRDENHNKYCSRVCCMYSLKLAHLIKEKLPDTEVSEYYIDMRAFGKGYEEFYERIKAEGIHLIRGRSAKITKENGKLIVRSEDIVNDRIIEQAVDMAVLAIGLEARDDAGDVSEMLGISKGEDGWFVEANYDISPVDTSSGGIYIAGACQGPKDIPDSVAQASAAASGVLKSIIKGSGSAGISSQSFQGASKKVDEFLQNGGGL